MTKLLRLLRPARNAGNSLGSAGSVLPQRRPGEGFREFTTPRRAQSGSTLVVGKERTALDLVAGIVPRVGVNIP